MVCWRVDGLLESRWFAGEFVSYTKLESCDCKLLCGSENKVLVVL